MSAKGRGGGWEMGLFKKETKRNNIQKSEQVRGGKIAFLMSHSAEQLVICCASYQDRSAEADNAILQYHDHSNSTGIWHHGRTSPMNLQFGKRYGFLNPGTDLKAKRDS